MYKLNRRATVRRYTSAKNEFGGLVSVLTGAWNKWASVDNRSGFSVSDYQQEKWEYEQRFVFRFEKDRPTKSNDLIEYEGRLFKINSISIDNEGFKAFEIIRTIRIDSNINSTAPVDIDSIGVINYTGIGDETTFTNEALIGKVPFGAFKDGVQFVIVTGTPTGKQVRINSGTALTTWGVPFNEGEVATIIYHG